MIHQYKNNGYNIVLDVYSGSVHVMDDLCYDVTKILNEQNEEHTQESLMEHFLWRGLKIHIERKSLWRLFRIL